jgi:hypothetical protein
MRSNVPLGTAEACASANLRGIDLTRQLAFQGGRP